MHSVTSHNDGCLGSFQTEKNIKICTVFLFLQRLQGSEHCGTLLFCGGTNWDLIGRRELPKNG